MTALAIGARFQRTIFSETYQDRKFRHGASVAEIVESFPVPKEFATHGVVILKQSEDEKGTEVSRAFWHLIRPKPGTALFISCAPKGGDGKQIFALVAAIALIALTAWIGGGALGVGLLAPYIGPGTAGAKIAAAAVGVAGSMAMAALSKPVVGQQADANQKASGQAGISQNILSVNQQLPVPLGAMRVSPPQLMRPFTTIENTDQYVHGAVGLCGPLDINAIKVNETAVEDLPEGQFEYEIREGHAEDEELTLVRECGFEETINLEMARHRLEQDNSTLIEPYTESYPQPHIFRSARRCDRFRLTFAFPQGLSRFDSNDDVLFPLRIEIRKLGETLWRKLPEMHLELCARALMRQEIIFVFGSDEAVIRKESGAAFVISPWKRFYSENAEWVADNYFRYGSAPLDFTHLHIHPNKSQVFVWLDPNEFPHGQYEFRVCRGFVELSGGYHTFSTYTGGLFSYRDAAGKKSIPSQSAFAASVVIQSYTTFRAEYPFAARGLALLAFKAKNLQINSISFDATPIVPVWNGIDWNTHEPSSNPAALARWVLTGPLNARPRPIELLEGFEEWYEYCEEKGLSCNALVTEGSVERAATLAANCGDAVLRESDTISPVIDRDRSLEPATQAFSAHNMTSPLVMRKSFTRMADGIYPTFIDAQRDYAQRTLEHGIYADGVDASDALMEGASYDGLVFTALVKRRAALDLRRAKHRATAYSWGVNQEHLVAKKGEIVALAHDLLAETYAMGRVRSFNVNGEGNLISVTLNTNLADLPAPTASDFFSVDDVFKLSDVFALGNVALGMQIRLADNTIVTVPVSGVENATLLVEQGEEGFPKPNHLKARCLVHVGWRDRVSRRVIITNIVPRKDYDAQIEAIDEAPQIFAGL
jgi:hypothetical protein